MIKLLHSADWHLDSPLLGREPEQAQYLRRELRKIPGKVVSAARQTGCAAILLAGDLFDGPYTRESLDALRNALEEAAMPVLIAPGNHDPIGPASAWTTESWPENVYIFRTNAISFHDLPELDCRIYGAAFTGRDCPALLAGFHAEGGPPRRIGLFHGDPTQAASPYNPISTESVRNSGLSYLALGHIHKGDQFPAGDTLCAWPGCPMGRGFDELGPKGVLLVTLADTAEAAFLPLDTPRFYDLEAPAGDDPAAALARLLPPVGNADFYRIALTGECAGLDSAALKGQFARFPNLALLDRTQPPVALWGSAGADTLEGIYFDLLRKALEGKSEDEQRRIRLAAQISRQILNGQEVTLP